jgi:hypothetical protein
VRAFLVAVLADMAAANRLYEPEAYRELEALRLGAVTSDAAFMDSSGAEENLAAATAGEAP